MFGYTRLSLLVFATVSTVAIAAKCLENDATGVPVDRAKASQIQAFTTAERPGDARRIRKLPAGLGR